MADVSVLPGVSRPDLAQVAPVEAVLRDALDAGLKDVAIVGRAISGGIVVWGSQPDGDAVVGLLMRGVDHLVDAEQVTEGLPRAE